MTVETPIFINSKKNLNIFPIGSKAVSEAIGSNFSTQESADTYFNTGLEIIEEENPYANDALLSLACEASLEGESAFTLGVFLAYDIFKKKAGDRKLPVLTSEFVQNYFESAEERRDYVYGIRAEEKFIEEIYVIKNMFALLEKDAYNALEDEIINDGCSLFESKVYLGFINSYFLFREGFSNSSNWE